MSCIHFGPKNTRDFLFTFSLTIIINKAIIILLKKFTGYSSCFITIWIKYSGELIFGLCYFYIGYQKLMNNRMLTFLGIPLLNSKNEIEKKTRPKSDSNLKIFFLCLLCAILDLMTFFVNNYILEHFFSEINLYLLEDRLITIQIFFSAIICIYSLKLKIVLHQCISLTIILFCLVFEILIEYFSYKKIENNWKIIIIIACIIFSYLIRSVRDCIEKHLMEFDYCSPYKIIFYEGLFGTITMLILYFIIDSDNKEEIKYYWLVNIGLIFYGVISAFINLLRLSIINYSTPMNKTTSDSFVVLCIFVYMFISGEFQEWDYILLYKIGNIVSSCFIMIFTINYNKIITLTFSDENKNENEDNNLIVNNSKLTSNSEEEKDKNESFTTEGDLSF